jgi:cytochrome b561
MPSSPPATYSVVQKSLHWLIALVIILMIPVGVIMTGLESGSFKNNLYEMHKSFGVIVMALIIWRLIVRWRRGAPTLEADLPDWQKWAANISHKMLYLLIALVPLAGWAGTSMCCAPVKLFWSIPVTLPLSGSRETVKALFQFHEIGAFLLAGLVVVHISAALYHHFIRKDATLRRMLFRS